MRRDLLEGFAYADMAPFVGWGELKLPPWVRERYVSLRAFGWALFVCRCTLREGLMPLGRVRVHRYWRWWLRRAQIVIR